MALRRILSQIASEWRDLRGGATVRDGQLRYDTAHLYLLTLRRRDPKAFAQQYPPDNVPLDDLPPFEEQAEQLKRELEQGTVAALRAVKASAKAHPSLTLPAFGKEAEELDRRIQTRLGFSLRVKQSSIEHPEAGNGLFLEGRAEAGTVVCLYPGVAYKPQDVRFMKNYPRIDKDNPYLLWRYDGVVLDGIPPMTETPWEARNRCAAGHRINHVPPGMKANVLQFMMDYRPSHIPRELYSLVPNVTFDLIKSKREAGKVDEQRTGSRNGIIDRLIGSLVDVAVRERVGGSSLYTSGEPHVQKGLVFVATRVVEDEELFFNYRFNAHGPDWYVDPDPDQSKRRWASSPFWE